MPAESLVISDTGERSADEPLTPFNPRTAAPFVNKSISEETRRYRQLNDASVLQI